MTVKRLTIGDKVFSLNALIANPDGYLPLMQPLFRASVFAKKENEDFEHYVSRLFKSLYNRENAGGQVASRGSNRTTIDESCDSILNALGIDIVKKCPVKSSVIFKSSGHKYRMTNANMNKLAEAIKHTKIKKRHKLTNSDITIGVELEFIGFKGRVGRFSSAMEELVGENRYANVGGYNKNEGKMWILGKDCSVKPRGSQCGKGMAGFELTSPLINLGKKKDLEELCKVCDLIKDVFGGEVNRSCGTHVHMSFPVESATDDLVIHFARSYRKSEPSLFDKVVPFYRQENHAYYSKSVSVNNVWDRYRKLNFNNVKKDTTRMHLEFRQLDGTLEYEKILSWIKIQKLFVDLTLESWNKHKKDEVKEATKIDLEDVIVSDIFDSTVTENLMKMSKLVA